MIVSCDVFLGWWNITCFEVHIARYSVWRRVVFGRGIVGFVIGKWVGFVSSSSFGLFLVARTMTIIQYISRHTLNVR